MRPGAFKLVIEINVKLHQGISAAEGAKLVIVLYVLYCTIYHNSVYIYIDIHTYILLLSYIICHILYIVYDVCNIYIYT